MRPAARVVLNTIVLYAKILMSMAIALISVPLVLKALGASDYGLYNLISGVVAMLAFLNSSLTVSSQRYMSVSMGSNDIKRINQVYNTSFYLHLILGFVVVVLFEIGAPFINKLNIDPERMWCAHIIYQFLIISTFSRIISVPFDAIINAHEDMVTFAVIEIIDSILMLVIAFSLSYISFDRLVYYGISVCLISLLTLLMKYLWCRYKYRDYHINVYKHKGDLITKEMTSFAGWNLFGGIAIMGRNQGVAIIINLFLGTIANAAYGIANQINGALSGFSGTFQKAINPQLMKSEGMNDRDRLLRISYISSKFSVLALSFFSLPLIILMPDVLSVWLKDDVPHYTMELSRCILIMTIVYQFSVGIMSAIQAVGNIRNYQITMGCLILLNIPVAYVLIKWSYPVYYVTIGYIVLEIISLIVRIFMAKKLVSMRPIDFFINVIKPSITIISITIIFATATYMSINALWPRLIITSITSCLLFAITTWFFALDTNQRTILNSKLRTLSTRRKYHL